MTLIRTFLVIISALVIGPFFTVWTVQRTHQIGLLKALGASTIYVVRDALGQLAIVITAAIAIGIAIAIGTGALIGGGIPFRLDPARLSLPPSSSRSPACSAASSPATHRPRRPAIALATQP